MNKNETKEQEGAKETGAAEASPAQGSEAQNNRHGKIWRLPHAVRTELNQRLFQGEKGPGLLAWLKGLPEVRQVMKDYFAGAELTVDNLSRWRKSGYQEWLAEERAGGCGRHYPASGGPGKCFPGVIHAKNDPRNHHPAGDGTAPHRVHE
jgi:hypothetical protein